MKKKEFFIILGLMVLFMLAITIVIAVSVTGNNPTPKKEDVTTETSSSALDFSSDVETISSSMEEAKETQNKIEQFVEQFSLEEKVGQLFLARVPVENAREDIKKFHLGGYMLFGRDISGETSAGLKMKIEEFQKNSTVPLLIVSDEEGGSVSRLGQSNAILDQPFLSPKQLYEQNGMDAIRSDIKRKAEVLKSYGIHASLSPVADVTTEPTAFMYERALGQNAKDTAKYVEEVVEEMKEEKIGSTLKHFPGYGNNLDSHTDIVYDNRPLEELEKVDFLPFIAGIEAGADSILVSHTVMNKIDDSVPASLSFKINEIIRKKLNFDGVVMTDDMDMAGLAKFTSQNEAGLKALQAGNDLVLSSSYKDQIPYVIKAVKDKKLSEERVEESAVRIIRWKVELGIIDI